jgi:mono/diheme cytochrome c family protein
MPDTKQPAKSGSGPEAGKQPVDLTGGDIAKFGAALLASIGLGSLVGFARRRASRKADERERVRQAERAQDIEQKRQMGHEPSRPRMGLILAILGGMAVLAVAIHLGLYGLYSFFAGQAASADVPLSPLLGTQPPPPAPRLQPDPRRDWAQLRATDEAVLNSYGRAPDGAVRIPIDRAIQLLAQRGMTVTNAITPELGYDQAHDLESAGGQPPELAATPEPIGQGRATPAPTGAATPQATQAAPQATGTPAAGGADAAAGQQLFTSLGCIGCHQMDGKGVAPSLRGVYGSQVKLQSGETVTADEGYIRNSILNPTSQVVAGYQPVMPSFQGRVSDADLAELVAYIRSLGGGQ